MRRSKASGNACLFSCRRTRIGKTHRACFRWLTRNIPNGIIGLREEPCADRVCFMRNTGTEKSVFLMYGAEGGRYPMDNKLLLMQCAKELFYAKGYDAVGVQEIVDRAGITKPTLYYYFGSKQGLLKTLLETHWEELRTLLKDVLDEQRGIREDLYRLANAYFEFFERDREFYMLLMSLFYSARENEAYQEVKPFIKEFYAAVVRVFERAEDQLGNMNGRQKQFAIGFIGTINHYLLLHCELDADHREKVSQEKITSLVNQFMYGIFS